MVYLLRYKNIVASSVTTSHLTGASAACAADCAGDVASGRHVARAVPELPGAPQRSAACCDTGYSYSYAWRLLESYYRCEMHHN